MQSENDITIVHLMTGMRGLRTFYVQYFEHRRCLHVEAQYTTPGACTEDMH